MQQRPTRTRSTKEGEGWREAVRKAGGNDGLEERGIKGERGGGGSMKEGKGRGSPRTLGRGDGRGETTRGKDRGEGEKHGGRGGMRVSKRINGATTDEGER